MTVSRKDYQYYHTRFQMRYFSFLHCEPFQPKSSATENLKQKLKKKLKNKISKLKIKKFLKLFKNMKFTKNVF